MRSLSTSTTWTAWSIDYGNRAAHFDGRLLGHGDLTNYFDYRRLGYDNYLYCRPLGHDDWANSFGYLFGHDDCANCFCCPLDYGDRPRLQPARPRRPR